MLDVLLDLRITFSDGHEKWLRIGAGGKCEWCGAWYDLSSSPSHFNTVYSTCSRECNKALNNHNRCLRSAKFWREHSRDEWPRKKKRTVEGHGKGGEDDG